MTTITITPLTKAHPDADQVFEVFNGPTQLGLAWQLDSGVYAYGDGRYDTMQEMHEAIFAGVEDDATRVAAETPRDYDYDEPESEVITVGGTTFTVTTNPEPDAPNRSFHVEVSVDGDVTEAFFTDDPGAEIIHAEEIAA